MKTSRREFLRAAGLTGLGLAGSKVMVPYATGRSAGSRSRKVVVEHARATLEDGEVLATPFWRVESGRDGPSLVLIAAQHGNEVIGTEVARRFQEVCSTHLVAGSVWLVPVANLLAVRARRHSYDLGPEQNNRAHPSGANNMQSTWPGDPRGNPTARLAYALDQAVVRHGSHLVDMHCWAQVTAAESLTFNDHPASQAMGDTTTTRFISYRPTTFPQSGSVTLARLLRRREQASLTIELSGQFSMPERQVQIGLNSMSNIARMLGMMEGQPEPLPGPRVVRSDENSHQVRAPCSGMFVPARKGETAAGLAPEDPVTKGQELGHIIREHDLERVPILAPVSGYLWKFGLCHWNLCDASLPALHPYAEEREAIAMVVTV